ncbi:hypothetical protein P3T35_003032 [Kitasatospora sp. GP30]|uniref:hypothetical protein n=1 Tax=Kitasatospora sp. GP30 TaxID=3035084 RepID=UPI000C7153A7|nr:hypothetical protein [Kitasatospora sp. GP30]MDH6141019.1 hypothetical protein [Kitasatospora sp. GP30]
MHIIALDDPRKTQDAHGQVIRKLGTIHAARPEPPDAETYEELTLCQLPTSRMDVLGRRPLQSGETWYPPTAVDPGRAAVCPRCDALVRQLAQ